MVGTFVARFLKIVVLEFRVIFVRLIRIARGRLLWTRRNYVGVFCPLWIHQNRVAYGGLVPMYRN